MRHCSSQCVGGCSACDNRISNRPSGTKSKGLEHCRCKLHHKVYQSFQKNTFFLEPSLKQSWVHAGKIQHWLFLNDFAWVLTEDTTWGLLECCLFTSTSASSQSVSPFALFFISFLNSCLKGTPWDAITWNTLLRTNLLVVHCFCSTLDRNMFTRWQENAAQTPAAPQAMVVKYIIQEVQLV